MRLPSRFMPSELSSFQRSSLTFSISPRPPPISSHLSTPLDLKHLTSVFHNDYHRLDEITEFVNELSRQFPRLVELVKVGQSVEGREILGIKIEQVRSLTRSYFIRNLLMTQIFSLLWLSQPGNKKLRPRVVVQGAQHARDVRIQGRSSSASCSTELAITLVDRDIRRTILCPFTCRPGMGARFIQCPP